MVFCHMIKFNKCTKLGPSWVNLVWPFNFFFNFALETMIRMSKSRVIWEFKFQYWQKSPATQLPIWFCVWSWVGKSFLLCHPQAINRPYVRRSENQEKGCNFRWQSALSCVCTLLKWCSSLDLQFRKKHAKLQMHENAQKRFGPIFFKKCLFVIYLIPNQSAAADFCNGVQILWTFSIHAIVDT